MKKWSLTVLAGLMWLVLATDRAQAQCTSFPATIPDGRVQTLTVPAGGIVGLFFNGTPGRSYSIDVTDVANMTTFSLATGAANVTCPSANVAGVRVTTLIDPISGAAIRHSFTATTSGFPFYVTRLTNSGGSAATFSWSVSDTTMFSPTWSTNGTFDTFYSLQNTTNSTCNAALTLRDAAGVVTTTAALAIPSGATGAANTAAGSLGATRNKTGTATVTHDCPPSALLGQAAVANFTISPPYIQYIKIDAVRETH